MYILVSAFKSALIDIVPGWSMLQSDITPAIMLENRHMPKFRSDAAVGTKETLKSMAAPFHWQWQAVAHTRDIRQEPLMDLSRTATIYTDLELVWHMWSLPDVQLCCAPSSLPAHCTLLASAVHKQCHPNACIMHPRLLCRPLL